MIEVQNIVASEKPDIVIVMEILPKHSILGKIQDAEWFIKGYDHITNVNNGGKEEL